MHDGSMNTIEEVVRYFSKNLSDIEVAQISDYVRSIGAEGEYYAAEQIRGTAADGSSFYNKYQSGAVLNALVVRKQSASASDAVATLVIYDKDGEAVHTSDYTVSELSYNESYVITFAEGLKLPDDGSYTISFREYGSDKLLASTLTVK
jgi:hypothetical protein